MVAATRYTQVPRSTLWLLEEGEVVIGGGARDAEPAFGASVAPFYLGKTAVTNAEYEAFAPAHARSPQAPDGDDPVVDVSFSEAVAYCAWYAALAKKPFRLPTEVEWEYACRAGTRGRYFWGDDPAGAEAQVWDAQNSQGRAHPGTAKRANPWGLCAMLGNVWEWTSSLYLPYPVTAGDGRDLVDEPGPRVLRGGSYREPRGQVSCATRRGEEPTARFADVGFRIARSL